MGEPVLAREALLLMSLAAVVQLPHDRQLIAELTDASSVQFPDAPRGWQLIPNQALCLPVSSALAANASNGTPS